MRPPFLLNQPYAQLLVYSILRLIEDIEKPSVYRRQSTKVDAPIVARIPSM
jgi:hypothetical protein